MARRRQHEEHENHERWLVSYADFITLLFAFFVVCVGVLVLRLRDPDRPRPFRVPFVWLVAPLGALACVGVMLGLPTTAWVRFGVWMVLGTAIYLFYGLRHSRLREPSGSA